MAKFTHQPQTSPELWEGNGRRIYGSAANSESAELPMGGRGAMLS
jgi:hypothetical protein